MGIITAIVAIVTVGQLLYAMAPALSAGVASLASSGSILPTLPAPVLPVLPEVLQLALSSLYRRYHT
jgi:hypothetical protein